ncbi:MAG: HPr family phosphocarrier protein [Deltaproteobacteria bacterium]|nr:HPr family phosphocarrier protein [Deltaproteobacteria bacterium]
MAKKEFTIVNKLGLHARAAAMLVQLAGTFTAEITVSKAGLSINGKSIMGVLMLAAACDSTVIVEAVGIDEEAALEALGNLIKDGFGELNGAS